MRNAVFAVVACLLVAGVAQAQNAKLTVQMDKPGAKISPILNGVFFEDINFAADGGLYPERIKNRSFEFTDPWVGWRKIERGNPVAGMGVIEDRPLNANNPHYLRITIEKSGDGFGLANDGFRGVGLTKGEKFAFSVYARSSSAKPPTLTVEFENPNGQKVGDTAELSGFTGEWKKYSCAMESPITDAHARFAVLAKGEGIVDLDMISLFPQETFNHRPNGLRADLGQLVKDLKPGFLRFPGGCIVEGRVLASRYQWKTTIGDVAQRKLIINRWNTEFSNRSTPDYFQSFGLGFFEYFQFCEDIGAKPLPVLNCGMACEFNSGELCPVDELGPYIQDALDLIEFANGPASSTWGAKRAAMGHPAPFNMTMLGVGNEQWGPQYFERYTPFSKAIKEKYPEMKLVAGAGPEPDDARAKSAWEQLRALHADFVDEHYYKDPAWFISNVHRYDTYDRNGPKVFAGEFATHTQNKRNNWEAAISEAALRTGLERNGDVVQMASYAPLFAHVDAWQWPVNLIWYDNLHSFGTPSYYVQKLFAVNCGSTVLPATLDGAGDGLFFCTSRDDQSKDVILKVVNNQTAAKVVHIGLAGAGKVASSGPMDVISSLDLVAENTLDAPTKIAPVSSTIQNLSAEFDHEFPAKSLTVIRIPTN